MKKTLTAITTMMMIGSFLTMTFGMTANASYKGDNEMVEYDPANYIEYKLGEGEEISTDAQTTPTLSVVSKNILFTEDIRGMEVPVEFIVTGADKAYACFDITIHYDTRLHPSTNAPFVKGEALAGAQVFRPMINEIRTGAEYNSMKVMTTANDDVLRDGVIFTVTFCVPKDAEIGDLYPIGFEFAYDSNTNDAFTNVEDNASGHAMQDWLYTKGMQNGCIRIVDNPNKTFETAEDIISVIDENNLTEEETNEIKAKIEENIAANKDIQVDRETKHIDEIKEVGAGYSFMFMPVNLPKNANIYWFSDNTKLATVDNGIIHVNGDAYGKATIYAVVGNCMMDFTINIPNPNPDNGDANNDNEVNIADEILVMQATNNEAKYGINGTDENRITAEGVKKGNVDRMNGLDLEDARQIHNNLLAA